MLEQLAAVWDRVHRAEEHLDAIKEALLAYYNADGSSIRGEYNPDAEEGKGAIQDGEVVIAEIDPRLNTLIGEFLHNCRSSLDHLAWQLVLGSGTPSRDTHFPILKTDPGTDKKGQRIDARVEGGISAAAQTLINAVQPYHAGDRYTQHPLWLLHELWNIDKHRHVIAKGSRTKVVLGGWDPPRFKFTSRLELAAEHGAKLRLVPDEPDMDVDAHTTIEIAIHEPEHRIERPLWQTLKETHEAVNATIDAAEACCLSLPTRAHRAPPRGSSVPDPG